MPIPTPRAGESQDDFHGRCMGDDTMVSDYSDVKQRNAVCYSAWDEKHGSHPKPKAMGMAPMMDEDHADFMERCQSEGEHSAAECQTMWEDHMGKSVPAMTTRGWSVLTVKSLDTEQRMIEGWATRPTVDRVGDIVEPMGAKFSLPMPLLHHHKHDQPVGQVIAATASKDGIQVKARFARVTEPGPLKDRIDTAWQEVKSGLVRGLSIGFKALEYEPLEKGGIRFTKTAWHELSLVTLPACSDATISVVKSADMAALGQKAKSPGVAGKSTSTVSLKRTELTMSKTIAEQLEALQAARAAKSAQMEAILQKSMDEGRSTDTDEQESFDTLQREVEQIDDDVKRFDALNRLNQTKAVPVTPQAVQTPADGAAVRSGSIRVIGPHVEPGVRFARVCKCLGMAQGNRVVAAQIAEDLYSDDQGIIDATKAAVQAGTTGSAVWAKPLIGVNTSVFADFLEFLRPQTILGKFGTGGVPALHRVPFRVGLISQDTGGTGYWVGEGQPKPVTSFAFSRTFLEPLKVANIAVITEELMRDSSPSADVILRNQLAAALTERLDIDFTLTTKTAVTGVSPASITNGTTPVASTGNDEAAIRKDILALMSAFQAANNPPTSGVWIMSSRTALGLQLHVNPLGQQTFPGIGINGGTFFGMPVIVSDYIEVSGSPTARIVILVNANDIYLADEGGITVDMSREASLQMDNAPTNAMSAVGSPQTSTATTVVSLWQTDSVGFRAERTVNWARRRLAGVKYLTGVNWGSQG